MSRRALRWAGGAVAVLAVAGLLLSTGPLGDTLALFNGETQNANSTFAGGWVGAAATPTATATGYDMALAWTPGTHGPVTGQQLLGVDNTTSSNCTGAAYGLLATMALPTTASFTDASRGSLATDGHWFCYELVSTSGTVWTAATPLAAVQLGLVANALAITNVGTAGRVNANDTIAVTFNQRPILPANNGRVCVVTPGTIVIGDTSAPGASPCGAADNYNIGKLTLTGATLGSTVKFTSMTFTLSASAPWVMTVTLAGTASTSTVTGTPTWTFTPAASILSFVTTHQATICSTATTTCQPTSTNNF